MDTLIAALGDAPEIKREATARFFFKKYPYRITVDAERYSLKNTPRSQRKADALSRWRKAAQEMIAPLSFSAGTKIRNQGGFTCLYFEAAADAVAFLGQNRTYVIAVSLPETEAAHSALSGDHRLMIRDTLFWGQYRWSVVLKILEEDQLSELREWLAAYEGVCAGKTSLSYSHASPRVYFAEEDDLFMFSLSFFNRINRIEKALLKKEIAGESLVAEGAC